MHVSISAKGVQRDHSCDGAPAGDCCAATRSCGPRRIAYPPGVPLIVDTPSSTSRLQLYLAFEEAKAFSLRRSHSPAARRVRLLAYGQQVRAARPVGMRHKSVFLRSSPHRHAGADRSGSAVALRHDCVR
ncbi:MAG: hypothetical protein KatS3mg077_0578 [Candidatus Binatia bacterium]|nr:MAG: hypothetical protein KatS3mg077_0578 [Candidatus Binatia bacterium]